jgi:hypothetical protein
MTSTGRFHARTGTLRRRLALGLAAVLLAACGQTPTPSSPPSITASLSGPAVSPPASASSSPAASSSPEPSGGPVATPAPSGPAVMLPAGVQYPEPASPAIWDLPSTSTWYLGDPGSRVVTDGQVTAILGIRGGRQTRLAVRDASGSWTDHLVDAGAGVRGPGLYTTTDWILSNGLAAGPKGFLVFGQESIADSLHHGISRLGFTWFSRDGAAWIRTDLRGVLGANAAFVPRSAMATADGWLMAGDLSSRNLRSKAVVVVLSSNDGSHWRQVSRIASGWATTSSSLDTLGGRVVLAGTEWVCDANGFMLNAGIGNPTLRLWSSPDGGITWKAADSRAGGVVKPNAKAPSSARGCTGGINAYATTGTYFGVVNGRAVAVSAGHARIATSTDLMSWQVADLEGAVPVGGSGYEPSAARSLVAVPDGPGWALLSLESRRDEKGAVASFGSAVFAWTSADGAAWSPLLAGPPLELTPNARLIGSPDGAVYLADQKVTMVSCGNTGCKYDKGPVGYRRSQAGQAVPVPACVPAPAADCAFATLGSSLAGADLSGIDLFGAQLSGSADLSGANLSGARLTGLTLDAGANLAGADLSGADLGSAVFKPGVHLAGTSFAKANLGNAEFFTSDTAGASFANADLSAANLDSVDLSGVILSGATMHGTSVNQTLFAARLAGVHLSKPLVRVGTGAAGLPNHDFGTSNLAGWFFGGAGSSAIGDLRGADFRHAGVALLGFSDVDLTGARFPPKARSQIDFNGGLQVYFAAGVICPDGKPATKVSFSYDCRIGR